MNLIKIEITGKRRHNMSRDYLVKLTIKIVNLTTHKKEEGFTKSSAILFSCRHRKIQICTPFTP